MLVTDKGQVTIPKHIRLAAGVAPGSEVSFSLEGGRIVITPGGTQVGEDRRARLKAAAARARASLGPDFRHLGADEIMDFIRGDEPPGRPRASWPPVACPGPRAVPGLFRPAARRRPMTVVGPQNNGWGPAHPG